MHPLTKVGLLLLAFVIGCWAVFTWAIPHVGPSHLSKLAPLAIFIPIGGGAALFQIVLGGFLSHRAEVRAGEEREAIPVG